MRVPDPTRSFSLGAAALLMLTAACAGNTAPPGFLPSAEQSQRVARGGWMELEVADGSGKKTRRVEGELIAVRADSVWVLTADSLAVVATDQVREGKVTGWRSAQGTIVGYTAVGVLATISNGYVAGLTAPLWIIVGTATASSEASAAQTRVPGVEWAGISMWARFPQGLPPDVDRGTLRPPRRQ